MNSKSLKKKVIEDINLDEGGDAKSLMTTEQKSEIERRSAAYQQGKIKASSWKVVKKRSHLS